MIIYLKGEFITISDDLTKEQQEAEVKRLKDAAAEADLQRLARLLANDTGKPFSGARWVEDPEFHEFDPKKGQL